MPQRTLGLASDNKTLGAFVTQAVTTLGARLLWVPTHDSTHPELPGCSGIALDCSSPDRVATVNSWRAALPGTPMLCLVPEEFMAMGNAPLSALLKAGATDCSPLPVKELDLWLRLRAMLWKPSADSTFSRDSVGMSGLWKKSPAPLSDDLTKLYTRESMDNHAPRLIEHSIELGNVFAVVILEVDGLSAVRAQKGDAEADAVFKRAALVIRGQSRATDYFYRYNSNQIAAVLMEATSEGVTLFSRRVQKALTQQPQSEAPGASLSISAGAVCFSPGDTWRTPSIGELCDAAGSALTQARTRGVGQFECTDFQKRNN